MSGFLRIPDPARLGLVLAELRTMLGYTREQLAREIAAEHTDRRADSIAAQLRQWDRLDHSITIKSLGPLLDALGYDLALAPRAEDA